jgi:E3 ubiquitin-protein ligase DOA10
MLKRIFATITVALLVSFGIQVPAYADPVYDFEVVGSATVNTTTVPSVITWTLVVSRVGDLMGFGGAQDGYVSFTAPTSISLVLSDDCDTSGNTVTCYWFVEDGTPATFEVSGLVTLLALGAITITPTFTMNSPRTDAYGTNDSDTVTCTAVTSLLVTC